MKLSNYKDTIILVDPVIDDYGSERIGRQETVKCIFGQVTGFTRGANQANVSADAIAYLDPTHFFVQEKYNRLEGMLIITSFGEASTDAWYKITSVSVGKRSLLDNTLDNVQVNLSKTTAITSIS